MTVDQKSNEEGTRKTKTVYKSGGSDAVYGFGLIGAWVYYLSHAATFGMGVLGLLKGIVWPAILVYELLKYFKL
jgi:hypothetical protein